MKEPARLYSRDIHQIDLDIHRTFRNHIMFRERYGIKWVPAAQGGGRGPGSGAGVAGARPPAWPHLLSLKGARVGT